MPGLPGLLRLRLSAAGYKLLPGLCRGARRPAEQPVQALPVYKRGQHECERCGGGRGWGQGAGRLVQSHGRLRQDRGEVRRGELPALRGDADPRQRRGLLLLLPAAARPLREVPGMLEASESRAGYI